MTPIIDVVEMDKEVVVPAEMPGLDGKYWEVTHSGGR